MFECMTIKSGTTKSYGLVGVDMALMEEVCYLGMGFKVLYAEAIASVAHTVPLLPTDKDVALSASSCSHENN